MTHQAERPPLQVAEPPFDPDYDNRTPSDPSAERAILSALISTPELGDHLATKLDDTDFYRHEHETIWSTWHRLTAADGVPPDPVTLNAALVRTKNERAVRALAEIALEPANPLLVDQYAQIVRDTARLRVVAEQLPLLSQLVHAGDVEQLERRLGDAVEAITDAAMRFGASQTRAVTGFRDLSWILTGQEPQIPPPAWVQHEAGHFLFYSGKVNGVFGDPETAKTWIAQCALVQALNEGGTAAMVDVDHNGEVHTAARLLLLGARPEHLADPEKFRYYDPQEAAELRNDIADITARRPDVVLIDSLGEIFPMLGLNTNDGDEITGGLRLISKPADTGSCVIFIDHLPKATEARTSGFAIGSIAKKRAIRGSYIRAEERTKPAPGQVGRIGLFIEKDTSGELRKATPGGKYVGTFVLDSTEPHITTWQIVLDTAPTGPDGQIRPTHLMEGVSRFVEQNDQCTFRDIKESVSGKDKWLRSAIAHLVDEGFMSKIPGPRNSILHHAISLYREAEDDQLN